MVPSSLGESLEAPRPFPSGSARDDAEPPRSGRFPGADGPAKAEGPLSPVALSALRDSGPGFHSAILWRSSAAPVVSHSMRVSLSFFLF